MAPVLGTSGAEVVPLPGVVRAAAAPRAHALPQRQGVWGAVQPGRR
jgi:hypothetical protein